MKKKETWKLILGILAIIVLVAVYGGDSNDKPNSQEINTPAEEIEVKENKPELTKIELDWEKLSEDFKADPSVNETFVKDVCVALGDNGYIQITAALADATEPEVALDYADTLLRRLNGVAQYQNSSIASGNTEIFGGLYDSYCVQIGIAPLSKTSDSDEWFVFDAIAPGVQCKHTIELQKMYR